MKAWRRPLLPASLALAAIAAIALAEAPSPSPRREPFDRDAVVRALEADGCATLAVPGVRVCRADYSSSGHAVEALSFRPVAERRYPGVLLIPGFSRTAYDQIGLGVRLAGEGLAGLAVTQPGFGRSEGPPDFVGPRTIRALEDGLDRLKRETHVDAARLGVYGFSRGGMAAALLAVRRDDLGAAVFGAGIYDFQRALDDVPIEGIRQNMKEEAGTTREAIEARSAILRMDKLRCPVLILHGEKDDRVPLSQALLLQDRLRALGKEFEIRLFPDRPHGIGPEVAVETVSFLKKKLGAAVITPSPASTRDR